MATFFLVFGLIGSCGKVLRTLHVSFHEEATRVALWGLGVPGGQAMQVFQVTFSLEGEERIKRRTTL